MRNFLLSAGLMLTVCPMSFAGTAPQTEGKLTRQPVSVSKVTNNIPADRVVKRLAPGVSVTIENGRKRLHTFDESLTANKIVSAPLMRAPKAAVPEGYVLFESFEDWDGTDASWTPEGWSVEMRGLVEPDES